jgi:hypothetical protein
MRPSAFVSVVNETRDVPQRVSDCGEARDAAARLLNAANLAASRVAKGRAAREGILDIRQSAAAIEREAPDIAGGIL